jgi:hypothetical protein
VVVRELVGAVDVVLPPSALPVTPPGPGPADAAPDGVVSGEPCDKGTAAVTPPVLGAGSGLALEVWACATAALEVATAKTTAVINRPMIRNVRRRGRRGRGPLIPAGRATTGRPAERAGAPGNRA